MKKSMSLIKVFILKNLNIFLLISIIGMLFISPLSAGKAGISNSRIFFFTIIFLSSAIAVKTKNNFLLTVAIIIVIFSWLEHIILKNYGKFDISFFITFFYFGYILVKLIIQLIKAEHVDANIIMESINIFLLIGIMGAIILNVINDYIPGSLNTISSGTGSFNDYLYFSFVTITSLGYGDISPILPLAKSIIIFLAIIGQFYIGIVMAFLISKLISSKPLS